MWRKALRICKKTFQFKAALFCLVFLNNFLFAVDMEMPTMPSMPSMPAISGMPSMPSVTFDNSFYAPSLPENMVGSKKKSDDSENKEQTEQNLGAALETGDFFTSILGDENTLTANDMSNLSAAGLFTDLASLGLGSNVNSSTDVLLQQILKELEELKAEQKKASLEDKEKLENTQKDSENFSKKSPAVLRFKINEYDIKNSLVEVFLSKAEPDGSFLLTADRRYTLNGKTRTETFYFLFKTKKAVGMNVTYDIIPNIIQDSPNPNSFMYRMCQLEDLTAEKTGNLVVLRYTGSDLNINMLLNLDAK